MSDKVGYLDGNGRLYVADSDREIVIMLADTEWGDTPPPLEWKERVRMRARVFDFEIEFHDASSFLDEMERIGIGQRVNPEMPGEVGVNFFEKIKKK